MVETIEGIVLKTSDYQEKSKILQVFTKEHGLIGIYLKGANQYKSKAFAIAQPISHAFFNVNYHSGLSNCYNGELIQAFQSLKLDFTKNVYIYHLFELIMKNIEQHEAIPYLYDLLLDIIAKSEKAEEIKLIKIYCLYFELKLLHFIGIDPVLSNCVECGSREGIANFDIGKGGFICQKHLDKTQQRFSIISLEALYHLYHQDIGNIALNIDDKIIKELRALVSQFYLYHLGVRTNASKYLE